MQVKDLAALLASQDQDAFIDVAWEEHVVYSELTSGTEDRIDPVQAVYLKDGRLVFSAECYIVADKIWPSA